MNIYTCDCHGMVLIAVDEPELIRAIKARHRFKTLDESIVEVIRKRYEKCYITQDNQRRTAVHFSYTTYEYCGYDKFVIKEGVLVD